MSFLPCSAEERWGPANRTTTASPQVDVEPPVIVDVAEVRAHRHEHLVEAGARRHIVEGAVFGVLVELERGRVVGHPQIGASCLLDGGEVTRHEEVRPAVVVVIKEPGGETAPWARDSCPLSDLRKRAVAVVVIEKTWTVQIRRIQVNVTVVVVIACRDAFCESEAVHTGCARNVLEVAVRLFLNS